MKSELRYAVIEASLPHEVRGKVTKLSSLIKEHLSDTREFFIEALERKDLSEELKEGVQLGACSLLSLVSSFSEADKAGFILSLEIYAYLVQRLHQGKRSDSATRYENRYQHILSEFRELRKAAKLLRESAKGN